MKLNYKQTLLVGLAFMSINGFWQLYYGVIPLMLTNTFNLNETLSGVIMALDGILALFLLPYFGSKSDKIQTKMGKRMPYILFGTLIAVFLMNILPIIDNSYYQNPKSFKLILFIIVLVALLITMCSYRSPAIALMPDITPDILRSKGNAIINLMGSVGAIIYLLLASVLYPRNKIKDLAHVNYQMIFIIFSIIMLVAVIILFLSINEAKLSKLKQDLEKQYPELNKNGIKQGSKLTNAQKKSLIFLLLTISLLFMGYNAVTVWYTTYVSKVLSEGLGKASTCLLISTASAIVAYIPLGNISGKLGRKKMLTCSIIFLIGLYALAFFTRDIVKVINLPVYITFAFFGIAWASVVINTLPMVLAMCDSNDTGKFTGYYYTASKSAQIVTPILAGTLMRLISYKVLFLYSMVFTIFGLIALSQVKNGE